MEKTMKMHGAALAGLVAAALSAEAVVPRDSIYQEGGDIAAAVAAGFPVVFNVKMGADGRLDGVDAALDALPAGHKAIVNWKTDDPRSLDLFADALKRHPHIFEKCYIFMCSNRLANAVQGRFIWPRHMSGYRLAESAGAALAMHRAGLFPIVSRDAAKLHAQMTELADGNPSSLPPALRLVQAVGRPFLPGTPGSSTRAAVYARVAECDAAADSAWRNLRTRAEYDAYRKALREKMLRAIGPFPERTPLNFRVLRTIEHDGFAVHHVSFESMPGLFVPGYLFVPSAKGGNASLPAVVVSCGHGEMRYEKYLLACLDLVRRGIVALVFEAYDQGEREQHPELNCCQNHDLTGMKAHLLGSSFAMLRIWDGMRAIDCVEALPYVDRSRIGYMGQSGGGTMTSLMTALDLRLKATAPSGYLTNFGYLCKTMGPQDAEQNIFGQLSFGLNHTSYVLMPDTKVLVTGKFDDFFPYGGTAQLMETVRAVARMLGEEGHYAMNFVPGPHGWTEGMVQASSMWMSAWLDGRRDLLPIDMAAIRRLDFGFDVAKATKGLVGDDPLVFGGTPSTALPGARNIHEILRDDFRRARATRRPRSAGETAALVRRLAGIRLPSESGARLVEMGGETIGNRRLSRLAFVYPDGFAVPAVLLEPADAAPAGAPVLLAGARGRAAMLAQAEAALARGSAALLCDVSGTGEIIKLGHIHYGNYDVPEEDISIMLYLLGESMVGRRAGEILYVADFLRRRFGKAAELVSDGSVAVAAAHAFAAERDLFASVRTADEPPSWAEVLERADASVPCAFTWCVNGALREYDWTDLLGR